jgi:hypothetical protein
MSYTISKTNGTTLIVLNDGLVDKNATSLSLVGKNVSSFGDAQNENFVHLLENFAGELQPRSPLQGQLWFDSSANVARPAVFDGVKWRPLAVSLYSNTSTNAIIDSNGAVFTANQPGDFWFDSVNKQLHVVSGTSNETTIIGPEAVKDFGTTKLASVKMIDTANQGHPVIQMVLDGEIIGILSNTTFNSTATGFTKVFRGLTFKNYSSSTLYTTTSSDVVLHGLHEQLDRSFTRRSINEHIQADWYIDNSYTLNFGTTGQSSVTWSTATSRLLLTSLGSIRLQSATTAVTFDGSSVTASANTVNIGSTSTRFNIVYANTVDANTVTANVFNGVAIFDNGARVLTTATIGDFGTQFIKGTENQITVTPNTGTVTLSLSNIVDIKRLRGGNAGNAGTISGTWTLESGSSLQATYADLAECYQADTEYEPGTVLEFGGEFEVTIAEDGTRRVAGVVSTAPAYLMNRQLMGANVVSVALSGRVPCKVRGKICKGDMMVSAGSGYARAEYSPIMGSVIGKALENFEGVEGVIEVVVGRL